MVLFWAVPERKIHLVVRPLRNAAGKRAPGGSTEEVGDVSRVGVAKSATLTVQLSAVVPHGSGARTLEEKDFSARR